MLSRSSPASPSVADPQDWSGASLRLHPGRVRAPATLAGRDHGS